MCVMQRVRLKADLDSEVLSAVFENKNKTFVIRSVGELLVSWSPKNPKYIIIQNYSVLYNNLVKIFVVR